MFKYLNLFKGLQNTQSQMAPSSKVFVVGVGMTKVNINRNTVTPVDLLGQVFRCL